MMQSIPVDDSLWEQTFPHRVVPRADERLAGLILRCDEVNGWDSGTTMTFLIHTLHLSSDPEKMGLVLPPSLKFLPLLASWLAIPESELVATTYLQELSRLYDRPDPPVQLLGLGAGLQFCPACLDEERMLRRTFLLPHITICPIHCLQLQSHCTCHEGKPPPPTNDPKLDALVLMLQPFVGRQRLFARGRTPFTCPGCKRDWAKFPRLPADPNRFALEHNILAWYEFFFTHGSRVVLHRAAQAIEQAIEQRQRKRVKRLNGRTATVSFSSPDKTTLGHLVDLLVSLELSPDAIEGTDQPLLWRPLDSQTRICPKTDCPFIRQGEMTNDIPAGMKGASCAG